MANIIIPPEHQSAPKTPPRIINPFETATPTRGPIHKGDDDLESVTSDDPRITAEYLAFEERRNSKSPEGRIEDQLREYEKNYNDPRTKAQRWQGQERWQGRENEEMRLVRIMHPHSFIEKLNRSGIRATVNDPMDWFRENLPCKNCGRLVVNHTTDWMPGMAAPCPSWVVDFPKPQERIWLNSFTKAGRVGVNAIVDGVPKTVTTLQYPFGPEWSIMRFDRMDVPTNERYRGWRTALLVLIVMNVITEEEAHKAFGPPIGPAGEFYRQQLSWHRAVKLGLRLS